ncbi:60S ribosomal protein L23a [Lemmus lemmus]
MANKHQIKLEVKKCYDCDVAKVNTLLKSDRERLFHCSGVANKIGIQTESQFVTLKFFCL